MTLLGDGARHSGAALAERMGVTRAAVWNQVKRLREEGVEIEGTHGHGYCLTHGFEALAETAITHALAADQVRRAGAGAAVNEVRVLAVTDSTNQRLLDEIGHADIHGHALLTEYQTAGRGRRGDKWLSAPGAGLCLSLGWRFDPPPTTFSALSLVIGVAIVESLRAHDVAGAMLKWPNDIVWDGRKLAGILIEMRSEAGGPSVAVIGLGLNIRLSAQARERIGRPADGYLAAGGAPIGRNALAATLLAELGATLERFAREGFPPFRARWSACDSLAGQAVRLELPDRAVTGIARGCDAQGALLIEHDGRQESFVAGHLVPL